MQNAACPGDALQLENEEKFLNKFSLRKFTVPREKLKYQTTRQVIQKDKSLHEAKKTAVEKKSRDEDASAQQKRVHLEYRDLSKVLTANVPWWLQTKGIERNLKGEKLVSLVEDTVEEYNTAKARLVAGCNSKLINNPSDNKSDINQVLSEALKPFTEWQDTVKESAVSEKDINNATILNAVTSTQPTDTSGGSDTDEVSWIEQRLDKVQHILFDLAKSRLFSGCENCHRLQLPPLPINDCYKRPLTREVVQSIDAEQRRFSITDAIIPPSKEKQNGGRNGRDNCEERERQRGAQKEADKIERSSISESDEEVEIRKENLNGGISNTGNYKETDQQSKARKETQGGGKKCSENYKESGQQKSRRHESQNSGKNYTGKYQENCHQNVERYAAKSRRGIEPQQKTEPCIPNDNRSTKPYCIQNEPVKGAEICDKRHASKYSGGARKEAENCIENGKQREQRSAAQHDRRHGSYNGPQSEVEKVKQSEQRNISQHDARNESRHGAQNETERDKQSDQRNGTHHRAQNETEHVKQTHRQISEQNSAQHEAKAAAEYKKRNEAQIQQNTVKSEKRSEELNQVKSVIEDGQSYHSKKDTEDPNNRTHDPMVSTHDHATISHASEFESGNLESCADYVSNLNVVNVEIDGLCTYMHKMIEKDVVTDPNLLRSIIERLQEVRQVLSEFTIKVLDYCSEDNLKTQEEIEKAHYMCEQTRPIYVEKHTTMSPTTGRVTRHDVSDSYMHLGTEHTKSRRRPAAETRFRPPASDSSGRIRRIISSDMACYCCAPAPRSPVARKRQEMRHLKLLGEICSKTCSIPLKGLQKYIGQFQEEFKGKYKKQEQQQQQQQHQQQRDQEAESTTEELRNEEMEETTSFVNDNKETQTDLTASCHAICEKMIEERSRANASTKPDQGTEVETIYGSNIRQRSDTSRMQTGGEDSVKTQYSFENIKDVDEKFQKNIKDVDEKIKNLGSSVRQVGTVGAPNITKQQITTPSHKKEDIEDIQFVCKWGHDNREIDTQTEDTIFTTEYDKQSDRIPLSKINSFISQVSEVCTCLYSMASTTIPLSTISCPHLDEIKICHNCTDKKHRRQGGCHIPKLCDDCDNVPIIERDLTAEIEKRIGGKQRGSIFLKFTIISNGLYHIQISNKSHAHLGCLFATEEATITARNTKGFDGFITLSVIDPSNTPTQIESLVDHAFMVVQQENRNSK